jgi:hypothetical protein
MNFLPNVSTIEIHPEAVLMIAINDGLPKQPHQSTGLRIF